MPPHVRLRIDPNSSTPAYRQIADGLRTLLVDGWLTEGEGLPTVRDLGLELGVHFNTVAEAYRLLAEEGWVDLRRKRGAIVIPRAIPSPAPEAIAVFERRLRDLVAETRAQGVPVRRIRKALSTLAEEQG